ncbi:MAG: hypothetical protein WCE63_07440 [Acidobacteriaceae bacterium]
MASSLLPTDALDRIARQQAKMLRAVDEGRWPFKLYSDKPVKRAVKPLSPFDELAGRLMAEARPKRGANGWLADAEYLAITVELDKAGFDPRKELAKPFTLNLKKWNTANPRIAIKTFSAAFASLRQLSVGTPPVIVGRPRRAVQKRLDYAEAKWRERLS